MKKLFCFLTILVGFLILTINFYQIEAISKDKYFDNIGGGGTVETRIVYTGIEATLHEKGMGHYISNGGMKYNKWDLYVKSSSDGIIDYRDVSNLFLVSYLGEIYPISGYAEYLNGIVDIDTPKFRVLESNEHFFSGKITSGIIKSDSYNVFVVPACYAVVHYQNGSTDNDFQLAKATNSAIDNATYLLFKFDTSVTFYYMFKDSEVGTTSKITSGSILDDDLSVAHLYTQFSSISEFYQTSKDHYYYINNVLFLY